MLKMKCPRLRPTPRVGAVSFSLVIMSYSAIVIICCGDVLLFDVFE